MSRSSSLELGIPLNRSVGKAGAVESFQVVAGDAPSLILVEPTEDKELNAAVALENSANKRRQADQLGTGQPERIVVPKGPDQLTLAVSSSDGSKVPSP